MSIESVETSSDWSISSTDSDTSPKPFRVSLAPHLIPKDHHDDSYKPNWNTSSNESDSEPHHDIYIPEPDHEHTKVEFKELAHAIVTQKFWEFMAIKLGLNKSSKDNKGVLFLMAVFCRVTNNNENMIPTIQDDPLTPSIEDQFPNIEPWDFITNNRQTHPDSSSDDCSIDISDDGEPSMASSSSFPSRYPHFAQTVRNNSMIISPSSTSDSDDYASDSHDSVILDTDDKRTTHNRDSKQKSLDSHNDTIINIDDENTTPKNDNKEISLLDFPPEVFVELMNRIPSDDRKNFHIACSQNMVYRKHFSALFQKCEALDIIKAATNTAETDTAESISELIKCFELYKLAILYPGVLMRLVEHYKEVINLYNFNEHHLKRKLSIPEREMLYNKGHWIIDSACDHRSNLLVKLFFLFTLLSAVFGLGIGMTYLDDWFTKVFGQDCSSLPLEDQQQCERKNGNIRVEVTAPGVVIGLILLLFLAYSILKCTNVIRAAYAIDTHYPDTVTPEQLLSKDKNSFDDLSESIARNGHENTSTPIEELVSNRLKEIASVERAINSKPIDMSLQEFLSRTFFTNSTEPVLPVVTADAVVNADATDETPLLSSNSRTYYYGGC